MRGSTQSAGLDETHLGPPEDSSAAHVVPIAVEPVSARLAGAARQFRRCIADSTRATEHDNIGGTETSQLRADSAARAERVILSSERMELSHRPVRVLRTEHAMSTRDCDADDREHRNPPWPP